MGDLIFVAVVLAFFALTVAYMRGCEHIIGRDADTEALANVEPEDAATALEASIGGRR